MLARVCSRCGRIAAAARCPDCQNKDNRRRADKTRHQGRTTPHWRRVRAHVIARDKACRACGTHEHLSVHLDPKLEGNHRLATPDDCVTLCLSCHGSIDAPRAHRTRW